MNLHLPRRLLTVLLVALVAGFGGELFVSSPRATHAQPPSPHGDAPKKAPMPKGRGKADDLALGPPSVPHVPTGPLPRVQNPPKPSRAGQADREDRQGNDTGASWNSLPAAVNATAPLAAAATTCTAPTIDMQLLVLAGDGSEADLPAIKQALDYMGTPYTVWITKNAPGGLLPAVLSSGCHAFFQGALLTTDSLGFSNNGAWVSGLSAAEWQNLWSFEATFGVRQVTWYTYPTAEFGFTGTVSAVDTSTTPHNAAFTSAGAQIFSYANTKSPLAISLAYTYLAKAATDGTSAGLLQDAAGNALAVIHTYTDGRQNLALTFDSNANLQHDLVLAYGLVNWVTKGLFLGERQVYFVAQPDDVFIPDDLWVFPAGDCAHPVDGTGTSYRMTGADLQQVIKWQQGLQAAPTTRNLRLQMAFNAFGTTGVYSPDTLTPLVQANQALFTWINHTYDHEDLNTVSYAFAQAEFAQNTAAAGALGLTAYSAANLVTPGISGLTNQFAMQAAYDGGTRYVVSDTSVAGYSNPSPNAGQYNALVSGVLQIPRHPTNLYFNVSQPGEWVNEYNCVYSAYWGRNLTYNEILDKESTALLFYLLKGDADPIMFHQSNLRAYDGTHTLLGDLVGATLTKYNAIFTLPIASPDMSALGKTMADRMQYNGAGVKGSYVPGQSVTLTTARAATVPVTGLVNAGSGVYGGQAVARVAVTAGGSVTVPLTGKLGPAPAVTAVSPKSAVAGTKVTVTGTGFVAGSTTVAFGTNAGTGVSCTATQCTATSPAGDGTVDVSVTASGQVSALNAPADQFTYTYAVPTVTSISPTSGPVGMPVTITGTGFIPGTTIVRFGAAPVAVASCTATKCSVTAPAAAGTVDVTVTAAGQTSATKAADRFTYTAGTTFAAFGDALAAGWEDWSSGVTVNWATTKPVYAGKDAITLTVSAADGDLEIHSDTGVKPGPYAALRFAVQATQPGADFQVQLFDKADNQLGNPVVLAAYGGQPVVGFWKVYSIPLVDLGVTNKAIGGIMIADNASMTQPAIYVDEITFVGK